MTSVVIYQESCERIASPNTSLLKVISEAIELPQPSSGQNSMHWFVDYSVAMQVLAFIAISHDWIHLPVSEIS